MHACACERGGRGREESREREGGSERGGEWPWACLGEYLASHVGLVAGSWTRISYLIFTARGTEIHCPMTVAQADVVSVWYLGGTL